MLSRKGWVYANGFTYQGVMTRVGYLLAHCFTHDGNQVARQAMGVPMGIKPSPHFSNITCYPKEKKYALHTRALGLIKRLSDDSWVCSRELLGEEVYRMKYKWSSAEPKKVTFRGVEVEKWENNLHTTLYDHKQRHHRLANATKWGVHEPAHCLLEHDQLHYGFQGKCGTCGQAVVFPPYGVFCANFLAQALARGRCA